METIETKILVIEDEKAIADILAFNLKREGYGVMSAYDGNEGLRLALVEKPHLILLDIMLPGIDGYEVCSRVRRSDPAIPIIMLTAREEEADKILGLESGADDYVTKPFSMRELIARIRANIRRTAIAQNDTGQDHEVIVVGDIVLSTTMAQVYKSGLPVELSKREYDLFSFFVSNAGQVFSRETLMEKVWNYDYYGDLRTVDVTVRRLREKIENNPAEPEYILTRRGMGYIFQKNSGV